MLNRVSATCGVLVLALALAATRPEHAAAQPTRANLERQILTADAEGVPEQLEAPSLRLPVEAPRLDGVVGTLGNLYVDARLRYELDRARNTPIEWPGLSYLIVGSLAESAIVAPMSVYLDDEREEGLARAFASSMIESLATDLGEQALGRLAPF